jgi:TonB-linked SusC/RagA family outer membrane protein
MINLPKFLLLVAGICCLMLLSATSRAQETITFNGKVVDSKEGKPLTGATIQQVNGNRSAISDENGNFTINVPLKGRLTISMVGYKTQIINVSKKEITVGMDISSNTMDEVVVIGYTTQKKELLSGSVATIKVKESDIDVPTTSAGNLLAGRMSGVNVGTPNGLPGSQPGITIRTQSSSNVAPVLYVIDGKISGSGDFNNLSPNEIEEVTVLKDAATTAAYGSRAAGGVVLVTTKRGTYGKATINYSYNSGYDKRGKNMDLTNILQWGAINERIWGIGVAGPANTPWTPADSTYYADHDFGSGKGEGYRQINDVYRDPFTTTHNLSISGGRDKVKYFIGGSYVNQEAFIKNTGFKKYNLRANITADLNRDFSVFAGVALNDNQSATPSSSSDLGGDTYPKLLLWQPYMPSFTSKGLPVDYFWIGNRSGDAEGLSGYNNSENIKPVINLNLAYRAPFLEGLTAKASFMKSYTSFHQKIFTHPYTYYQLYQVDPVIWNQDSVVGSRLTAASPSLEKIASWAQDNQLDLQLGFERSFRKHHVNGSLVYERFKTSGEGIDAAINGFPIYTTDQWWASTGGSGVVNGTATKKISNSYGNYALSGRKSWIGQFLYDYAGKYVANFTYRYDGSANFAPDQRWGFFPSGSAAWIISKENFFKNVRGIDMLKLRASVGLTGNDNVGGFQWQDSYIAGSNSFFGVPSTLNPGIQYNVLPNPDITWEKYLNKNIGIDINFLHNFSASLDLWHTYTYDILGTRIQTTPPTFSRSLPAVNYGKEKAQGIDFSMNYNKRFGAVNFNAGVVASYGYAWYVQKDQNVTYDYQNQIGGGRTTTMLNGYIVDHMIRTQSDLDTWNSAHPGYNFNGYSAQIGQLVYKDLASQRGMGKSDSLVNAYDYGIVRKNNDPILLGLNMGVQWKGLSIAATFNGSVGYLKSFNDVTGGVEWNRMWTQWYSNSWTPSNPNAMLPKRYSVVDGTSTVTASNSNFWYADASFLRLKFLSVGYVIPQNFYKKYISSIRVYVSGSNLFIISKFNKDYYDPEMSSGTAFPIVKSYNAGVSVTF